MLNRTGEVLTDLLTGLAKLVADQLNIDLLKKFDVGLQIYFFQPDARNQQMVDEKTVSTSSMAAFIGFLVLSSGAATLFTMKNIRNDIKKDLSDNNNKKNNALVMQQQEEDYARIRTQAETNKFSTFKNRLASSPLGNGEQEGGESHNRENSLFQSQANTIQERSEQEEDTTLRKYLKCFSITENLFSLIKTRRNSHDDPELDVIEAMRAMSFGWGILTTTSLYVLTSSCRNIAILLQFFEEIIFAFISSGNLTPDAFIYFLTFMSFIKINQLYDLRKGLGPLDFLGLLIYRILKVAPIYYFVFFAGWLILPLLSTSINWFVADRLFLG